MHLQIQNILEHGTVKKRGKFLKNWFLNDLSMILAKQRVTDLNKSLAIPLLERLNNRRKVRL